MHTAHEKIRELRSLHEDGLLSQQEFDSRKNAILDAEYALPDARGNQFPPRPGTELGLMAGMEVGPPDRRYRLERLIAHGGMGQVWQATDLATHAELGHSAMVALKILPPQLTQSAARARLLVEEATEARKLAHENIVRVYEWARDPATTSYFIIMECLEGEDLDGVLAREGRLTLERALALTAAIAAALEYAWDRRKLVHRDIKPGNVFVTAKGDIKLLDFGIAARVRQGTGNAAAEAPGSAGTAGYRAPEAGTPRREPAQSLDVYAVAIMIYQMLEGRLPFRAPRSASDQAIKPARLSEGQWAELQRGFAWDSGARPQTVMELVAALRNAAADETHAAAEPPPNEVQSEAARLAKLARQKLQREEAKRTRAEHDAARRVRREALREQLRERRAAGMEKARVAEQEQRRVHQAKAAAAYRAEQQRARTENAGVTPPPVADAESSPSEHGILRDAFVDGSGHGPAMVEIAAGRFQMGSPEHERKKAIEAGAQLAWLERETPQHWVGIEQAFVLGRSAVTVGEWRRFAMAANWRPHGEVNWASPGFRQAEDHPVVGVSWDDAQKYVRWLSEQTGQHYRLPSEAEWEYACRAGTKTAFSFGDSIDTSRANYDGNYSYGGSPKGVFRQGTTPAGAFAPNRWGLYDMHGNVWEWVQDVVHDNYIGAPADGGAWEEGGDQGRRILRGGSWLYNPRYLRSALRNGYSAVLSNDIVGFRVARALAVTGNLQRN
ncbi:SUMF1/EgtB/PvdO family nonheme iron enzyme [Massilia sp. RP-1-19]|uniref:SUMF1/EgtB/PvdO family nonheme iron enzyme n=1 Tax=Massilia polaris TaxID=2728846 RepID=A0A848HL77_9BURK|nr:bifunctional serine/threonine-protein kinase/formylglycine-generating enzyme family protein [Massilia polaris]NML60889.1 SUMF1/EgtB/PvdO family nonheme iron enzyme [Massilia polaris]